MLIKEEIEHIEHVTLKHKNSHIFPVQPPESSNELAPYEHEQVEDEYEEQGSKESEDKGVEGEGSLLSEDVAVRQDVCRFPFNAATLSTVWSGQDDIHNTWLKETSWNTATDRLKTD